MKDFSKLILIILFSGCQMNEKGSLNKYQAIRDFSKTPEPKGEKVMSKSKNIFVVQKHDSSKLHYDLRLEIDGTLPSWAIPKGPSLDSNVKRLAMQTEDHPMGYANFEGVIPEGYGAGTVMVWDNGTYDNLYLDKEGSPIPMEKCLKGGKIKVYFHGHKLKGAWVLFKLKSSKEKNAWVFKKIQDSDAKPETVITEEKPKSVLTKRTLEEITSNKGGLNVE